MASLDSIREQALALGPIERAGLIEALLTSFDASTRETVDGAWRIEAEERIAAFEAGFINSISFEESMRRISSL